MSLIPWGRVGVGQCWREDQLAPLLPVTSPTLLLLLHWEGGDQGPDPSSGENVTDWVTYEVWHWCGGGGLLYSANTCSNVATVDLKQDNLNIYTLSV